MKLLMHDISPVELVVRATDYNSNEKESTSLKKKCKASLAVSAKGWILVPIQS